MRNNKTFEINIFISKVYVILYYQIDILSV